MKSTSTSAIAALLLALSAGRVLSAPVVAPRDGTSATAAGDTFADPILKMFDCSSRSAAYPGIQELFDADCYTHLCKGRPVTLNRWTNPNDYNRDVGTGNGATRSPGIFTVAGAEKFGTTFPSGSNSPEEWPPASARQGGKTAILIPVTTQAQKRQATLLGSKFYTIDPKVEAQDGLDGSKTGTWFRITKWSDAVGPYCKKLNELLADYEANFNTATAVIKADKVPGICTTFNIDLNGLGYDVGHYAWLLDPTDDEKYNYVGKHPASAITNSSASTAD